MAIVYQHRRRDTNEVFYIGIGTGRKRAYSKNHRNDRWYKVINKVGYEVDVLIEGISWEKACEIEVGMIASYGRSDKGLGTLVNMTDGGDGVKNPSEERRSRMTGANSPTKRAEVRKKMSDSKSGEKHPNWNKPRYKNAGLASKAVVQLDKQSEKLLKSYNSIAEATKQVNVNYGNISRCCNGKLKSAGGFKWKSLIDYNNLNNGKS